MIVKYNNFPIIHLYYKGSSRSSPSSWTSLTFTSLWVLRVLHLRCPVSNRSCKAYWRWQIEIPLEDLVISMPRKYFKFPKSFKLNWLFKYIFKFFTCSRLLLPIMMSSTYNKSAMKLCPSALVRVIYMRLFETNFKESCRKFWKPLAGGLL